MKTKLWQKETSIDPVIEKFTIGKDKEMDMFIAPFDVIASKAHAKMLAHVKLITQNECDDLIAGLKEIGNLIEQGNFKIEDGVEDIHSQIEFYLTEKLGDTGKKIHTGRSRNDQVLTAIKLYLKHELQKIRLDALNLSEIFKELEKKYQNIAMPGYTHFQIAMPSSFGMWLGAYAESISEDMELMDAAIKICDKNPLGSAAGYGTAFKIDREFTTSEMGFSTLNTNNIYAQMTRGKTEKISAMALSSLAHSISKFSYDVCLYMCQNFGFISFPEKFTTGSSIMPHKKNPDVFELLRAKCNLLQSLPEQFTLLTNNLPSGYHRDMQLTKELMFPAIESMKECLNVLMHVLPNIQVNENCMNDAKYKYLHSVGEIDKLVQAGLSFRDAYEVIAKQIKEGNFSINKNL